MRRPEWSELPEQVRSAVRDMCGEVVEVRSVLSGRNADFVATVGLSSGQQMFCKGVCADSPEARTVRFEARVASVLPPCAPRLLWKVEQAGWLLLGFEHIEGRHADLSPKSGDIPLVIDALVETACELTPSPVAGVRPWVEMVGRVAPWRTLRDQPPAELDSWTAEHLAVFAAHEPVAMEMLSGRTLAHADIHDQNLLVGSQTGRAHVMDWAWAKLAPPWVDLAHLVIRLIAAGHTPAEAENLVSRTALWRDSPTTAVTATAIETYGLWEHLRHADPRPVREAPTRAARSWAMHRTGDL